MIYYVMVVNVVGFMIMGVDKYKAKHNSYRISEKMLFGISLIGGSLGTWLGMYTFHHKTKHWYFVLGIPLIAIVQIWICFSCDVFV